ncbi:MAG: tetratricopeptide repeat protein [Nitrospira sp.]
MNRICMWIILALLLAGSACGPDQAAQQLEIAQFEERQGNKAHAKELYQDIILRYSDSPAAQTARTRLAELADKP